MEQELIALIKANDQKAFKALFDLYHTPLCLLANKIVKDKDQAKDIVQDVFIKLWKKRQQLEIAISLNAYLKRATANTCINYLEKISGKEKQDLYKTDLNAHSQNTTDQSILYNELKKQADYALHNLPPRTQAVFTLIRSEEMSYKEVAEALNISTKAVEKEMMKALKLLREALRDYLPFVIFLINIFF